MAYRVDDARLLNKAALVKDAGYTPADQYDTRLHLAEIEIERLTAELRRLQDQTRDALIGEVQRLERMIEGEIEPTE
jgi:hypothetical protein